MYYKNKNISYSQEMLNPVIKYVKAKKSDYRYITKGGLVTDQKIYKNRAKISLISYIKKEGNNFFSRKKIKDNEGVKHLIISPISPQLYYKLDKEEKEKLKNIIIRQIFKDLKGYSFIGGLEHKERNGLEHFHIHLGISESYDISPKNVDFLKRSLTKAILADAVLKDKLNLMTDNELRRETFQKKYNDLWESRREIFSEISDLFGDLLGINKYLKDEKNIINNLKKIEISETNEQTKRELRAINKEKSFLIKDIRESRKILKIKNEDIKEINEEIFKIINKKNSEKENIKNNLYKELKTLKENLNNDLLYFKELIGWENNIYIKFLKYKLKNKEIDLSTFFYLIAVNRYYQKQRLQQKQMEIKNKIREKNKQIKEKLKNVEETLKKEIELLKQKKDYKIFLKKFDEKNLKKLLKKLDKLSSNKKNILKNNLEKINIINNYIKKRQKKFYIILKRKKELEKQIREKRIREYLLKKQAKEVKKLLYNNETIEIINRYKIDRKELEEIWEQYLNLDSNINFNNFIKFLEKYGIEKNKQQTKKKEESYNYNFYLN